MLFVFCRGDPLSNVTLDFSSKEEAIAFAESQGKLIIMDFIIHCPRVGCTKHG